MKKKYLITKENSKLKVHLYDVDTEPEITDNCVYVDFTLGLPEVALILSFKNGKEETEEFEYITENEFGILYHPEDFSNAVILSYKTTYPILIENFDEIKIDNLNNFIENEVLKRLDLENDYYEKWNKGSEENIDEKLYYLFLKDGEYEVIKKEVPTEICDKEFILEKSLNDLDDYLEIRLFSNRKSKLSGIKKFDDITVFRNKEGILLEANDKRYFFLYKAENPIILTDKKPIEDLESYMLNLGSELYLMEKNIRAGRTLESL